MCACAVEASDLFVEDTLTSDSVGFLLIVACAPAWLPSSFFSISRIERPALFYSAAPRQFAVPTCGSRCAQRFHGRHTALHCTALYCTVLYGRTEMA